MLSADIIAVTFNSPNFFLNHMGGSTKDWDCFLVLAIRHHRHIPECHLGHICIASRLVPLPRGIKFGPADSSGGVVQCRGTRWESGPLGSRIIPE